MDILKDIIKTDLCTGCGICVSESKGKLTMKLDEYGFIKPSFLEEDVSEEVVKVCPFNSNPDDEVKDEDKLANIFLKSARQFDPKIGRFENTYAGFSKQHRSTSSSGGIATYIFEQLLLTKIVDNLFIVKEVNGSYEYQLFTDVGDIVKISKTRYIPVTLEKLFNEIDSVKGKVAISGVACFIKAIRLKQHYYPELKEKIPFLVGIICGGWKSSFYSDFLAQSAGIEDQYHHQEYRIKDPKSLSSDYSFGAFDKKDNFHQVKMRKLGDMWGTGLFKSRACDFCTDVLTELADISLGDAWLPEYRSDGMGTSVIVTRSLIADQLINEGIDKGSLQVGTVLKEKIIESQRASFSHRHDALGFRIRLAKMGGKQVPLVRKRFLKTIPVLSCLVQIQRQKTRKNSLEYWKETKNLGEFNKKIKKDIDKLNLLTRISHIARKFKIS